MNILNKHLIKHFRKEGYEGKFLKLRLRECNKDLLINFILFLIIVIVIIATIYTSYSGIKSEIQSTYLEGISNTYKNDDIVFSIAVVCSDLRTEEKQIRCVNNFVEEFYYYEEHNDKYNLIRFPSEIINHGGCCRDYAVFYKAIFSSMGYDSEFVYEPGHVYLKVFGQYNNYIIDQSSLIVEEKNET